MKKKLVTFLIIIFVLVSALVIFWILKLPKSATFKLPFINNNSTAIFDKNDSFAFNLYRELKDQGGNIFFSPYSITSAMGMVYEGARGATAEEIQNVFGFSADSKTRQENFANGMALINKKNNNYTLTVANALWAEKTYKFDNNYFKLIDKHYKGKLSNLDFKNNPDTARQTINDWAAKQTNDKIKNLLDRIAPETKLILTNAVYFFSDWEDKFDEENTEPEDFYTAKGKVVKADTMKQTNSYKYTEDNTAQILELPYKVDYEESSEDEGLSMIIILPKNKTTVQTEKILNQENFNLWLNNLESTDVFLMLPKFKFETENLLVNSLNNMGIKKAFNNPYSFSPSEAADFSGMTAEKDKKELFISDVIQKTFIDVNENSTEAAAVTSIIMVTGATLDEEEKKIIEFKADHPFIFIIRHNSTGQILFMGKINDPTIQ